MSTQSSVHCTRPTDVSPTMAVLQAVAEFEGRDPTAFEPPLYEVIDADALDTLIETGGDGLPETVRVTFSFQGNRITVDGAGRVTVTESK